MNYNEPNEQQARIIVGSRVRSLRDPMRTGEVIELANVDGWPHRARVKWDGGAPRTWHQINALEIDQLLTAIDKVTMGIGKTPGQ